MNEEETRDWFRFQSLAIGQLEYFTGKQNFVGLGIDPSFDRKERLFVSKWTGRIKWTYKTWDSTTDYQRIISSPDEQVKLKLGKQVPTIHVAQGELDNDFYSGTEKILEHLSLKSLVRMDGFGVDGTFRTVFIGDSYRESRFSWWEDLPAEWAALQPVLNDLDRNLEIARGKLNEQTGRR